MQWLVKQYGRQLGRDQRAELGIYHVSHGTTCIVLSSEHAIEAPNWTPDGERLLFNAGGELWFIDVAYPATPAKLETGTLDDFNNDHLISPDGGIVYASSDDGHIYAIPITGGKPNRVECRHISGHHCYLHGISPDGQTLLYVGLEQWEGTVRTNLYAVPADGGASRQLTDLAEPHDGPEFSPDGEWIYFNSERASPGHAQCFRMAAADGRVEQLTGDARVNWFPHPSPDGRSVVYLSYPPATRGHPADRDVILRLMNPDGSEQRDLLAFRGGQGTINVNSWAPDSRRFAFVAYPDGA